MTLSIRRECEDIVFMSFPLVSNRGIAPETYVRTALREWGDLPIFQDAFPIFCLGSLPRVESKLIPGRIGVVRAASINSALMRATRGPLKEHHFGGLASANGKALFLSSGWPAFKLGKFPDSCRYCAA
jgi:hypothetical protein